LQALFSKQDPVEWIILPGFHKRGSPLATIVS
jgi:hypothetical protein